MLFARDELERHHVRERGGLDGLPRKTRFPPIRHGKMTLVRIDLSRHKDGPEKGQFKFYVDGNYKAISAQCFIAEGQQEGRWIWENFVINGNLSGTARTKECLETIARCFARNAAPMRLSEIDGLIVPVMVLQETNRRNGRIENRIHPLSPDPDHPDHDGYHQLVSRCMKPDEKFGGFTNDGPGWDLYPQSKTYRLVQRRLADRLNKMPSGVTRLEERRQRTVERIEDRFCQAAA